VDFWHSLGGVVEVTLTSADPAGTMSAISAGGIVLLSAAGCDDPLMLKLRLRRKDLSAVKRILERRGDRLEHIRRLGLYWSMAGLLNRPVLLIGMAILVFLVLFLPTRIYFFRVEGNATIPTNLILEKCAQCGISFGASRSEVRSEKLKNALLEAMPELQWAGINTSGCVATISVRERSSTEPSVPSNSVSSIVAVRDGVISSITVTRGSAVCKVGQAVRAGQVLISGYTDCGIALRAERSEGEAYAYTDRELTVKLPREWVDKGEQTEQIKKYSLLIGKKRINLYKGSGISDSSCDKMYVENYVTLPGGFQLPIAIVTEVWTVRDSGETELSPEQASTTLSKFADRYLQSQMVAGNILLGDESVLELDDCYVLTGKYACMEMIGLEQNEEIITKDE